MDVVVSVATFYVIGIIVQVIDVLESVIPSLTLNCLTQLNFCFVFGCVALIKLPKSVISERERGLLRRTSTLNLTVNQLQRQNRLLNRENEHLVSHLPSVERTRTDLYLKRTDLSLLTVGVIGFSSC